MVEELILERIQLTISLRILLCLSKYMFRASGEPQFDNTCLFDWQTPHLGQRSLVAQPHILRFFNVGSWFIIAFLTKLWIKSGSLSKVLFQVVIHPIHPGSSWAPAHWGKGRHLPLLPWKSKLIFFAHTFWLDW